jgi:hypothetical protein
MLKKIKFLLLYIVEFLKSLRTQLFLVSYEIYYNSHRLSAGITNYSAYFPLFGSRKVKESLIDNLSRDIVKQEFKNHGDPKLKFEKANLIVISLTKL